MNELEPRRRRWTKGDVAVAIGVSVVGLFSLALLVGAAAAAAGLVPGIATQGFARLSTADIASLIAAGATLLLADFTALLAWFTRRSIAATQREADIAHQALAASNRHADIADETLKAVQAQAQIAERQVDATNAQARIAQEQLAASWRPLLAEPRPREGFDVPGSTDQAFRFSVRFVNIGAGPAFVAKAFLSLGAAGNAAKFLIPNVVPPGDTVWAHFVLTPKTDGVHAAISRALHIDAELSVTMLYTDISSERAWRSRARLVPANQQSERELTDLEVTMIEKELLA